MLIAGFGLDFFVQGPKRDGVNLGGAHEGETGVILRGTNDGDGCNFEGNQ